MRRFVITATVFTIVGLGAVTIAQTKITTAEEYQKIMKAAVSGFQGANKAVGSGALADAKAQIALARPNFVILNDFWSSGKTADAAGLMKDLMTNLDAADKLLAAPTPDAMAVQASLKMAQQSCGACHKLYREGDQQTGYKIKAGVL
jgi:mono/diheme cytochrome c family protein